MRTSVLLFALLFSFVGCGDKKLAPEDWLGRFTWRQPAIHGKITSWEILINRFNGSYSSILNASNPDFNFSYACDIKTDDSKLYVIYEKSLSKTESTFSKGDTLLMLQKKSDEITTTWNKLLPAGYVAEKKSCECFSYRGKNENGNEISLP